MSDWNPSELLEYLRQQGIELQAVEDRLHVRAPKGVLTAELRALLNTYKTALLERLVGSPATAVTELPLSEGQRALWYLSQLAPDSSGYNVSLALLLNGALSVPALQAAAGRLGRAHPLLHARIEAPGSVPVMRIDPAQPIKLEVVEAKQWSVAEIQAQAQALSERPFHSATEALSRLTLFRRSPEQAVLVLCLHHIIVDYWSLASLVKDLWTLYEDEHGGARGREMTSGASYADFVDWQRRFLESPEGAAQRDFWLKELAGELPVLELPTDYPRPAVRSERGDAVRAHLAHELVGPLRRLATAERTTPFAVFVSGLASLLHRYTGQDEILIGTPYHGRSKRGFESVVGHFINSLTLRARFRSGMTFRELIAQMHKAVVAGLAHADYPFSLLVETLSPKRDASRNPIFSVLVDWLPAADPLLLFFLSPNAPALRYAGGLQVTPLPLRQLDGILDQLWMVGDLGDSIALRLGYSTDLFAPATAEDMLQSFVQLLNDGVNRPDRAISALDLVTATARSQILACSGSGAEPPPGSALERLAAPVARAPELAALMGPSGSMSYRELDALTNQLAHALISRGVAAQERVGLRAAEPPELLIGALAIWKAGGAGVFIDAQAPSAERSVRDPEYKLLLTSSRLDERREGRQVQPLFLDRLAGELAPFPTTPPPRLPGPRDLACVLYGQADEPSGYGALLEHGAMNAAVGAAIGGLPLAGERVLLHWQGELSALPVDMLATLCAGGTLIWGAPAYGDPSPLRPFLEKSCTTVLFTTAAAVASLPVDELSGLHTIVIRGEPASPARVARFKRDVRIIGVYGHAETAHYAAIVSYDRQESAALLGRPAAHAKIRVLDGAQQLVPIGVVGEIYIGGASVARGPLRAEPSSGSFVPDPFSAAPGPHLFRTGALGRLRRDGILEYRGRMDEQGLGGVGRMDRFRIEHVILSHPSVKDCFLASRGDRSEMGSLLAYVVLAAGHRPTLAEFLLYLRSRLPPLAVPGVQFIDQLPLNRHGRIARERLPAAAKETGAASYVAPRDRLELELTQIWERVLKRHPIGIRDDFHSLGGHSLLAVQVAMQVQQHLQLDFDLPVLHQAGTVERLADFLRRQPPPSARSPLILLREGSPPALFLVHPIGGSVFCYVDLVRRCRGNQAIFGLQSSVLEEGRKLHTSMAELATDYVAAIRQQQPDGPYRIAGWSFGGILAFEIAHQLMQQGARVEPLTIIDSVPPAMLGSLNAMDDVAALSFLRNRNRPSGAEASPSSAPLLQRILADMEERGLLPDPSEQGLINQMIRIYRHHGQLLRSCALRPYGGRLLLLLASERWYMPSLDAAVAAWQELCTGRVETRILPGSHFSILQAELSLQSIAEVLQAGPTD